MTTLADLTLWTMARAVLLLAEILLALPLLYLLILSTGAIVSAATRRRRVWLWSGSASMDAVLARTFAILVPAHNEEVLIGKTLSSLAKLDYPADLYTVHVIADNCIDRTAEIAGVAGACVHVRTDSANRGKGHALSWAFDQLLHTSEHYDAFVVLDADTIVDPGLLRAFARGLAEGAQALQSHNAVLNSSDSPSTALRWLALSLMNYMRPLGRNSIGGSSTLTGNGMCLSTQMLSRHPWRAYGLSEDYQYYLTLVSTGDQVLFVPEAKVYSVMPTTVRQLQSQDIRWETMSPDSSAWQRRIAWHLLLDGARRHDWVRLDALAELAVPPLSVLAGGTALVLVVSIIDGGPGQILLAALLAGVLLFYAGSAFLLLRPPLAVYAALMYAPAYLLRKLWIYFVLRRRRQHVSSWVRTSRTAILDTQSGQARSSVLELVDVPENSRE
jgi:glycosyltransferase involved in cell wall biosynthesis